MLSDSYHVIVLLYMHTQQENVQVLVFCVTLFLPAFAKKWKINTQMEIIFTT